MAELISLPLTGVYSTLWLVSVVLTCGSLACILCPLTCQWATQAFVLAAAALGAVAWDEMWRQWGTLWTTAITFIFVEVAWPLVIRKQTSASVCREIRLQLQRLLFIAAVSGLYGGFLTLELARIKRMRWYLVLFVWVFWCNCLLAMLSVDAYFLGSKLPTSLTERALRQYWPLTCSILARSVSVCALVASLPAGIDGIAWVGAVSIDMYLLALVFIICATGLDDNFRSCPGAAVAVPLAIILWIRLLGAHQFGEGVAPDWFQWMAISVAYSAPATIEGCVTASYLSRAGWRKWKCFCIAIFFPICSVMLTLTRMFPDILMVHRLLGSACFAHVVGRCGKLISWPEEPES
eukprot:gnl/MRDRNA2_/MRDRNA2_66214_c0_seq2.p1 gnl/MRDRNA2_/MRDRNA2_66214_c0~~gnl/MRDRNA2_/MRDRNA2_66214_c0_seq2.p1  ORF type:complete len:387 (-),score=26.12 gnl/MRDRNA2_/MRDRNA2_66214_c0_seq2:178-1227(-)